MGSYQSMPFFVPRKRPRLDDIWSPEELLARAIERHSENKIPRRSSSQHPPRRAADVDKFQNADSSKWKCTESKFGGSFSTQEQGQKEMVVGSSIVRGMEKFKANPKQYLALFYPTSMLEWPENEQQYTLVHRAGTVGFKPNGVDNENGNITLLVHEYQRLPPFQAGLPHKDRDEYTDTLLASNQGQKLHTPILPGRGMGLLDDPTLKVLEDADPSNIQQGQIGDCWLLSGIASLAEYEGAIAHLFRKTKDLDQMPYENKPNFYTISLWDVATWTEVDIVVDERLCSKPDDGSGDYNLLGAKPSQDGQLWVSYLEKAVAAHCGGWDKINGGNCTHAWSLLTGFRNQYFVERDDSVGKFRCYSKYNPLEGTWADMDNSPQEGYLGTWEVDWPDHGGDRGLCLNEDELFQQMCAWDDNNYLMAASSRGISDKHSTGGIVDMHAYSIVDCRNDVVGTGIDLIRVRNPWGKGEMEHGEFSDGGWGWRQYPQIKAELNHVEGDNGVFWVTTKEFFQHYHDISLSATNMKEYLNRE